MGWTDWGLNPGGSKIFCTYPDQPWGLCSLLYNGDQVSSPRVKQPEHGVDHPSPASLLQSRFLLEKLNGSQLVKKCPAFFGTQRFITMFANTQPPSGTQVSERVQLYLYYPSGISWPVAW